MPQLRTVLIFARVSVPMVGGRAGGRAGGTGGTCAVRRLTAPSEPTWHAQKRPRLGRGRSWTSEDQAWIFLRCTRPRPTSTSISAEAMKAAIEAIPAI